VEDDPRREEDWTVERKDLIIVTGSRGFIGSALIGKLAGRFALVGLDLATTRRRRQPNASAST
jgi:nucleoside-diphosphate-sugar epimerase